VETGNRRKSLSRLPRDREPPTISRSQLTKELANPRALDLNYKYTTTILLAGGVPKALSMVS